MNATDNLSLPGDSSVERDRAWLQHELAEALAMHRGLLRQLEQAQEATAELQRTHAKEITALRREQKKLQDALVEAQRAHAKMVATLSETMRENTLLVNERDMWRARALRHGPAIDEQAGATPLDPGNLMPQITEDEINAIRRAMARLHHPDAGGDAERMKAWNATLDRIERHR